MNGSTFSTSKAQFTLSSNNANKHKETIMTYSEVGNHILRRYDTNSVFTNADNEIRNSNQGWLEPWFLSQTLWDLTLRCGGVYSGQTLRGPFFSVTTTTPHHHASLVSEQP